LLPGLVFVFLTSYVWSESGKVLPAPNGITIKYSSTGGWGYARWLGMEQKPYGKDDSFENECVGCHTPVKHNDYVFTHPAIMP